MNLACYGTDGAGRDVLPEVSQRLAIFPTLAIPRYRFPCSEAGNPLDGRVQDGIP